MPIYTNAGGLDTLLKTIPTYLSEHRDVEHLPLLTTVQGLCTTRGEGQIPTQLQTLQSTMGICVHDMLCNNGTKVTGATNHHLVGIKACAVR